MPLRPVLAVCTLLACALLACAPLAWAPALAQQPAPAEPIPAERAAMRFPQPVRVGDLLGRQVLRPIERQDVLGRVAEVVRHPDGAVLIVVSLGGVLGFGTRPVAVPVGAMALLGEYVALMDLTPEQLQVLPTFAGAAKLPPDEVIRMGLARPFH